MTQIISQEINDSFLVADLSEAPITVISVISASELTTPNALTQVVISASQDQENQIGLFGIPGPRGLTGPEGPIGLTGATGLTGPIGLPGMNGESSIGGFPVGLSQLSSGDLLSFTGDTWANVKNATLTDGGNF